MKLFNAAKAAVSRTHEKWNELSAGEKAAFVTTTAAATIFNPLLPVVYLATYGTAAVHDEWGTTPDGE